MKRINQFCLYSKNERKYEMVKLYSNDCPLCRALKKRLQDNGIEFVEESDETRMIDQGIEAVPMLQIEDDRLLTYKESLQWVEEVLNEKD